MSLKAISPFIASVLLIGFTIATGVIVYYFVTTLPKVQTQQVSSLSEQVISCAGGFFDINTLPVGIYRKAITIDNTANPNNLNDYQVLITNPIYNETGLVLSLHFNEGSGTIAYDSSGNGNHGNLVNNPAWTDGKFGRALSFNGVNSYVDIPSGIPSSILGNNPKMVILWFYPTQHRNGIVYMGPSGGGTSAGHSFRFITNASGNLGLDVSMGIAFSNITINLNEWNFIFAYWDGSRYFVGKVEGGNIQRALLSLPANNLQQGLLRIGHEQPNNFYARGIIDEVRIYNRILSDAEILALFQAKARLDYGDIRFTDSDGSTLLNYWQEADGKFWVKVPNIPASSTKTIYVYYGNPSATSQSNKDLVFPLYDFYPNYPNWSDNRTYVCGIQGMMGGYNNFGFGAYTQKTINLDPGTYNISFIFIKGDSWDGEYGRLFLNNNLVWQKRYTASQGSQICGSLISGWNELFDFVNVTYNHTGGNLTIKFDSTLDQGANDEWWGVDKIMIRKYTSPEPTTSVGNEESATINKVINLYGIIYNATISLLSSGSPLASMGNQFTAMIYLTNGTIIQRDFSLENNCNLGKDCPLGKSTISLNSDVAIDKIRVCSKACSLICNEIKVS